MKRYAGVIALAIAMVFGFGIATAYAFDPVGPRAGSRSIKPAEVKGEVLKVEENNYIVKDRLSGKDVQFAIETDVKAKMERLPKVGDQIEAQLTPEGYAKKVVFVAKQDTMDQDTMDKGAKDKSGEKDKSGSKDPPKDIGGIQAPGAPGAIEPK